MITTYYLRRKVSWTTLFSTAIANCTTVLINDPWNPSPQSYLNISFTLALGFQTKILALNSSNESNTFSKLILLKWIFLWLQMLSKSLNNRDICETHVDYRLALIHSTCNSNRQSELKVTHKNAPNAPPRFKNVIFQTHYVRQKNSRFIEKKTAKI